MTELLLDTIEAELFAVGLDFKREYDRYDDHDYINIIGNDQHLHIGPLWSEPTTGDDDNYFFDSDDIRVKVIRYGEVESETDLYPESESELVTLIQRIFDEGVDFLD